MSKFPILLIPSVALEGVLDHLTLAEIIDICSISSKACQLISALRLRTEKYQNYEKEFQLDRNKFYEQYVGELVFYQVPFSKVSVVNVAALFKKPSRKSSNKPSSKKLITVFRDNYAITIDTSRVHVEIVNLRKEENLMNLPEMFKTDHITLKICTTREFFSSGKRTVDSVIVQNTPGEQVSLNTMKLTMELLTIRRLCVTGRVINGWLYPGPIVFEKIFISTSSWIHPDAFFTLECKVMKIQYECLETITLNSMLQLWTTGGLRNLEKLEVHLNTEGVEGENKKLEVVMGIDTFEWNPKNRPKYFKNRNCSKAIDIRTGYGRYGSILFEENSFSFLVWHDCYLEEDKKTDNWAGF